MTPTPDPESAARRALQLLGGPLTLTPVLTGEAVPRWTAQYRRLIRLPGSTVEYDDAVTAYGLLACLEKLTRRIAEQDAALLAYLRAREEKANG